MTCDEKNTSQTIERLLDAAKDNRYYEITDTERLALQSRYLEKLRILDMYLDGGADALAIGFVDRLALEALDRLVIAGCTHYHNGDFCGGDVAIHNLDATIGRCCKCGDFVSDYGGQ
jgi:hypothetical protein